MNLPVISDFVQLGICNKEGDTNDTSNLCLANIFVIFVDIDRFSGSNQIYTYFSMIPGNAFGI